MIFSDYHIHTKFSGDSEAEFEDIISHAVSNGLKEICITDHQDFGYVAEGILFELDANDYYSTLCDVSDRYSHLITVKKGIETGLEPDKAELLHVFVNSHEFDFVIGSSHLINGTDPYYPEYFASKTEHQAFTEYFESILTNLDYCMDFDVYGHIDYVVRYSPNRNKYFSYQKYSDMIDKILLRLIENGKGIEINTSGYRSGLNQPNPCVDIVKRYKELGGEIITVGSDAHIPEHIGYNFQKAHEILKYCGFDYYTIFNRRNPQFVKI